MVGAIATASLGCHAPAPEVDEACAAEAPPAGTVEVRTIDCTALQIDGGDGAIGDVLLANAQIAAVIRAPENSLTLIGTGGGTLIDLAPWGVSDRLHEAAPTVADGWLDVDTFELLDDGVAVEGVVVSLPDRPSSAVGQRARVVWRLGPDDNAVRLEGNDGLWLHPAGDWERLGDQLRHPSLAMEHDGTVDEDLGGALRLADAHTLRIGTPEDAASWGDVAVSGRAIDATEVVARDEDGAPLARLPVDGDLFAGTVPSGTDTLRAEAPGRAPSSPEAPREGLDLRLGASGTVALAFDFDGEPARPVGLTWAADDGRSGGALVPAVGGAVALGAGRHTLSLGAGPSFGAVALPVEIGDDNVVSLLVRLPRRFSPGNRVAATLDVRGDRSRTWRGTQLSAARDAAGAGLGFAVFAPEDEVGTVNSHLVAWPRIAVRGGSRTTLAGGSIVSWPWSADADQPGHGATATAGLTVNEALVVAGGGADGTRLVAVDAALLDAPPSAWTRPPALIALPAPGALGPSAWTAWTSWLDAGALLTPSGPVVWAEVDDPTRAAEVDVEAALWSGRVCAGTGPLLTLSVDGAGPGAVAPPHIFRDGPRLFDWSAGGALDLDAIALIGEGGAVFWSVEPDGDEMDGRLALEIDSRWVALAGWSAAGAWAVTGAVWVDPP